MGKIVRPGKPKGDKRLDTRRLIIHFPLESSRDQAFIFSFPYLGSTEIEHLSREDMSAQSRGGPKVGKRILLMNGALVLTFFSFLKVREPEHP